MTDREKLLIASLGEDDRTVREVSVFDVMHMLYALGEEYRRTGSRQLALASA